MIDDEDYDTKALSPNCSSGSGSSAILVFVVRRTSSTANQMGALSKMQRTTRVGLGGSQSGVPVERRAETASNSPRTSKLPHLPTLHSSSSVVDSHQILPGQCSSNAQLSPSPGAPLSEPLLLVPFPPPSSAVREPRDQPRSSDQ